MKYPIIVKRIPIGRVNKLKDFTIFSFSSFSEISTLLQVLLKLSLVKNKMVLEKNSKVKRIFSCGYWIVLFTPLVSASMFLFGLEKVK
jgi:hypothetical protein